jgi:putative ABC transport system ATP-binding protein
MSLVRKHGATLLLVTHDRGLAASADRVLEMRDGRLCTFSAADLPRAVRGAVPPR